MYNVSILCDINSKVFYRIAIIPLQLLLLRRRRKMLSDTTDKESPILTAETHPARQRSFLSILAAITLVGLSLTTYLSNGGRGINPDGSHPTSLQNCPSGISSLHHS
jgi:hypothetical protein